MKIPAFAGREACFCDKGVIFLMFDLLNRDYFVETNTIVFL